MSYKKIINIINAHYGWSMEAHMPEYREEIKEEMKEMKKLVSKLQVKVEAFDKLQQLEEEWADESMEYIDSVNEGFADYDEAVLSKLEGDFAYGRANVYDLVYLQLKDLER